MTLEIIAPTSDDANRQRASIGWLNMQPTLQKRTTYIITNAVAAIWSQTSFSAAQIDPCRPSSRSLQLSAPPVRSAKPGCC
jgi:hypothetical protein